MVRSSISGQQDVAVWRSLQIGFLRLKPVVKWTIALLFISLVFILFCNYWVVRSARSFAYFEIDKLPSNEAGLVLGTSKSLEGGGENLYFRYRMEATARLFKEGKIKLVILSGNNDSPYYNEPLDMKKALLKLGVPESAMILDYSGLRTFDSVVRCKRVFKQDNITIISQDFHNVRALYIARHNGIDAVSFAAQDVPKIYSFRTLIREYLARPKAVLDVHLIHPKPDVSYNIELKRE